MSQTNVYPSSGLKRYRWQELGLFVIPCAILLLEMTQLLLTKLDPASSATLRNLPAFQSLLPIIGFIAAFFVVHVILNIKFRKADQVILPVVGLLSGLGVLMATRVGPDRTYNGGIDPALGSKQLIWVILGLIVCVVVLFLVRNIHLLARYKYTAALIGLILFCSTLVNTLQTKNLDSPTHDQLRLPGGFAFQPSELFKICIVIFFAAYLEENRDVLAEGGWRVGRFLRLPPLRQLGPIVLMLFIGLLLFLFVRELGLALLIYGIFLSMIYLGTGKIAYVIVPAIAAIGLGLIGYKLFTYVQARFAVVNFDVVNSQHWTAAQEYMAQNAGLQVLQGLIATSTGGVLGTGFGLGHAAGMVPVAESDMVFTSFAEEFGFAGMLGIIGLYLLLIYRGFRIATDAPDAFSKLLAAGLTTIFAIQTLIISLGNLKFMPLTGIPLPFLSYGGSSLIGNFIIVGLLLRISHNTAVERDGME